MGGAGMDNSYDLSFCYPMDLHFYLILQGHAISKYWRITEHAKSIKQDNQLLET